MNLVEQEKILLQVIEEMKHLIKIINEKTEKKIQTILLIGNTGAGKSTIFNWLNGAKFQYEQNKDKKFELKVVEEKGKTYAAQGSSTQSVTYLPNFYFLENLNHLIVDFPGFNDTHGPSKQLTIKLMFNEIITKSDVKLVVVTSSSTPNLPNRGVSLRELIANNLQQKNSSYQSIGLIINNYNDKNNLPDEAKQSICMNLEDISNQCDQKSKEIFKALQKKIIIIKKVSKQNFNEVLSEESRKSLINQLIEIEPGKYQPDEIDEGGFISDYIQTQTEQIITEQKEKFQEQLQESKKELEGKGNAFVTKLNAFIEGIKKIDYKNVNSILEFLKSMNSTSAQNQNFQIIFQYFYQYKEQIKFFKNLNQIIQDLKEIAEKQVKELQTEIDKIKKEKEREEQIKKEVQEKAQQSYELQREQYKNKMIKEKLETFQQLNRDLQIEKNKIQEESSKEKREKEQMFERMMRMMESQCQKSNTPQEESKKQEKETKKEPVNQQDPDHSKKQLEQYQKALENEKQIQEYKKQLAEQTSIKIKAEEDLKAFQAKFKFYESYSGTDKQKIADYEEKIKNAKTQIGYYEVLLLK